MGDAGDGRADRPHPRRPLPLAGDSAFVTLLAAGIAYVVSLRSVAWAGEWLGMSIPRDAEPVLVVLLLGVVTDYAASSCTG